MLTFAFWRLELLSKVPHPPTEGMASRCYERVTSFKAFALGIFALSRLSQTEPRTSPWL